MYCSSCGVAVAPGLSYCSYCGAKLIDEKGDSVVKTSELRAESLIISAMVGLFVLGLLAITVLMGVMKVILNLNVDQILPFALLSFLIMLMIEGVLVWRLGRHNRRAEKRGHRASLNEQATKELDGAEGRMLPPGSIPSVTEHTTRAFDPVLRERNPK